MVEYVSYFMEFTVFLGK